VNNPAPAKQDETACLYAAQVGHRRLVAPFYAFKYQVFYLLLDIDHIAQSAASARFFSHNRFNLLSFHDRDHGAETQGGLRDWAEGLMQQSGIEPDGGRIRLLVMPRLLGYAFNPISLWYCEGRDGSLRAVIAEVRNTFKEKHSYLLASAGAPIAYETALEKEKCFHVSPFFDLNGRYRFELGEPSQQLRVHIHETRDGVPILDASLTGQRRPLRDRVIVWQVLKMPFMTLKVVAGIHWEALKIWLRGGKFHSKPEPPAHEVS
tara:strand:- start:4498 stop:5286 length:789 start_codon:yes stop_codon:yes gene_type:complete